MVVSFALATGAANTRLSDVYGGVAGADPDPKFDIPYRQLILQAEDADILIGDATLTSDAYGALVDSTSGQLLTLGPFETGPVKLSQLYAQGNSGTLHILGIPF